MFKNEAANEKKCHAAIHHLSLDVSEIIAHFWVQYYFLCS